MALSLALVGAALAQDAITLSAVRYAQSDGLSHASITVHAHADGRISAGLACGGKTFALDTEIASGKDYPIAFRGLPQGSHTCKGQLALVASDGTSGEMPLSIGVEILPPLHLTVTPADLDVKSRTVRVRGSRPIAKIELAVEGVPVGGLGPEALGLGYHEAAPSDVVDLSWSGNGEITHLAVIGYDAHGLPGKLDLYPWSYDIPHEDVNFASNSADIAASEVPKLEKAWSEVQRVRGIYGATVPIQLYVAGYTDTVGDAAHNQTLSRDRAKAIAGWFKSRGFDGAISYQGFGESALAVPTADAVDEARNRRALYLLSAQTPAISRDVSGASWTRLP